jgi:hypothetical protein
LRGWYCAIRFSTYCSGYSTEILLFRHKPRQLITHT